MKTIQLNTGAQMPMLGLGVFRISDKKQCRQAVLHAIRTGYRLIDTATAYTNEDAVGDAVRQAIDEGLCTREELFITSKVWVTDMKNYDMTRRAVEKSLKTSGLEYFDLYLEHQAMNDYFAAWRGLEGAYKDGQVRAIGVSNFYPHALANLCECVEIRPAVDQIEIHPFFIQREALVNMKRYGVIPEAWAPIGGGRYSPFKNEILQRIAEAHGKTVAQVMLRWNLDRGVVVIPKAAHLEHIEENFNVWDFTLTPDENKEIETLDLGLGGQRTKHFDPDFVRMCLGK